MSASLMPVASGLRLSLALVRETFGALREHNRISFSRPRPAPCARCPNPILYGQPAFHKRGRPWAHRRCSIAAPSPPALDRCYLPIGGRHGEVPAATDADHQAADLATGRTEALEELIDRTGLDPTGKHRNALRRALRVHCPECGAEPGELCSGRRIACRARRRAAQREDP